MPFRVYNGHQYLVFILLNFYVLQIKAEADGYYRAAVVEYGPNPDINIENMESVVASSLSCYKEFIKLAAQHKVDIIVFPEAGLTGMSVPRDEDGAPLLASTVPDPALNMAPCDAPDDTVLGKVFGDLSCAAREAAMYVVVNLPEVVKCVAHKGPCHQVFAGVDRSEVISHCPNTELMYFNTIAVLDRSGVVIARYRKFHLNDEVGFSKPESMEQVIFETDFGVRFGVLAGRDLVFEKPTLSLILETSIADVVVPTVWFSELPFLTAVQYHAAWATGMNVNVLSAGLNSPEMGSAGSGIYAGRQGTLVATLPSSAASFLLVAAVPKSTCRSYRIADVRKRAFALSLAGNSCRAGMSGVSECRRASTPAAITEEDEVKIAESGFDVCDVDDSCLNTAKVEDIEGKTFELAVEIGETNYSIEVRTESENINSDVQQESDCPDNGDNAKQEIKLSMTLEKGPIIITATQIDGAQNDEPDETGEEEPPEEPEEESEYASTNGNVAEETDATKVEELPAEHAELCLDPSIIQIKPVYPDVDLLPDEEEVIRRKEEQDSQTDESVIPNTAYSNVYLEGEIETLDEEQVGESDNDVVNEFEVKIEDAIQIYEQDVALVEHDNIHVTGKIERNMETTSATCEQGFGLDDSDNTEIEATIEGKIEEGAPPCEQCLRLDVDNIEIEVKVEGKAETSAPSCKEGVESSDMGKIEFEATVDVTAVNASLYLEEETELCECFPVQEEVAGIEIDMEAFKSAQEEAVNQPKESNEVNGYCFEVDVKEFQDCNKDCEECSSEGGENTADPCPQAKEENFIRDCDQKSTELIVEASLTLRNETLEVDVRCDISSSGSDQSTEDSAQLQVTQCEPEKTPVASENYQGTSPNCELVIEASTEEPTTFEESSGDDIGVCVSADIDSRDTSSHEVAVEKEYSGDEVHRVHDKYAQEEYELTGVKTNLVNEQNEEDRQIFLNVSVDQQDLVLGFHFHDKNVGQDLGDDVEVTEDPTSVIDGDDTIENQNLEANVAVSANVNLNIELTYGAEHKGDEMHLHNQPYVDKPAFLEQTDDTSRKESTEAVDTSFEEIQLKRMHDFIGFMGVGNELLRESVRSTPCSDDFPSCTDDEAIKLLQEAFRDSAPSGPGSKWGETKAIEIKGYYEKCLDAIAEIPIAPPEATAAKTNEGNKNSMDLLMKREDLKNYATFLVSPTDQFQNSTISLCHNALCCNFSLVLFIDPLLQDMEDVDARLNSLQQRYKNILWKQHLQKLPESRVECCEDQCTTEKPPSEIVVSQPKNRTDRRCIDDPKEEESDQLPQDCVVGSEDDENQEVVCSCEDENCNETCGECEPQPEPGEEVVTKPYYYFRLAVFNNLRRFSNTGAMHGGFQSCSILACADETIESCCQMPYDPSALRPTFFESIEISGLFEHRNSLIMANTLGPGMLPVDEGYYDILRQEVSCDEAKVSLRTKKNGVSFYTFGIYSRDYARDEE